MAAQGYSKAGLEAYNAGRDIAKILSVDAATAEVPAAHRSEEAAFRQGIRDEQAGISSPVQSPDSPATSPAVPPVAAPPAPRPTTPKVGGSVTPGYREFLRTLNLQPVDIIRQVAAEQIGRIEAEFAKAPYFSETFQTNYAELKERLAAARSTLSAGDELSKKTDPASGVERRRLYSRAYSAAFSVGESLAKDVKNEDFLVLTLGNVVIPAAKAVAEKSAEVAREVIQTGKDVAAQVGGTARNVAYVLAAAAGLGLIGFALQRGKRR